MNLSHKPVYAFDEDGNSKVIQEKEWEKSIGEVFLEEQKIFRPRESVANAEPIKVFVLELLIRAKEEGIQQGKREAWIEAKEIVANFTPTHITREYRDTDSMRDNIIQVFNTELASLDNSSKG